MSRDVVHHFTTARGMSDMNCVFQVKMGGQRSQIIGVMIHVMAVAHLGGAATTLVR